MRRKVNTQHSSGRIAGSLVASNRAFAALHSITSSAIESHPGGESETKQFSGLQIDNRPSPRQGEQPGRPGKRGWEAAKLEQNPW